jgi:hypothetical protein
MSKEGIRRNHDKINGVIMCVTVRNGGSSWRYTTKGIIRKGSEVVITSKDPKYDEYRNIIYVVRKVFTVTEIRYRMVFKVKKYKVGNISGTLPFDLYSSELSVVDGGSTRN